jgi:hypothetical protein
MSNQSQDNQEIDILIKLLIKLLNFLDCLVPCYTEPRKSNIGTKEKNRLYALVYYCDKKFKQEDDNNSDNDFVKYKFIEKEFDNTENGVGYYIYLHRNTLDKVRRKCQDCKFCNIVKKDKIFWDKIWNDLNLELITNSDHINSQQEGKIRIYQIVNGHPTSIFTLEGNKLKLEKCDENMAIFIKDGVYIENIDSQSQNQNQQNQNQKQKHNTEKLLELKKLLITETTVELSKVINNVIEQQIPVDENLLEEAVKIILKNIVDSNDS